MNVIEVTAELKEIAKSSEALDDGVSRAPRLLAEPQYAGDGDVLLAADITAAIKRLPSTQQDHAKALLTPENGYTNWTTRIETIGAGNGGGRAKYAELILAYVAHELLELWRRDGQPANRPVTEQLERLSYELTLEIDEDDPRKHTVTRKVTSRVAVPAVRSVLLSHYYIAGPVEAKVEMLSPVHKYLTTIPDPLGSDSRWYSHIIDLGGYHEVDDVVCIETRERYCDKEMRLHNLFPSFGLHELVQVYSPAMEFIEISIRVPQSLVDRAKARAQISEPPLFHPVKIYRPTISNEGWASRRFDKLQMGNQYVLFFPGLNLYD